MNKNALLSFIYFAASAVQSQEVFNISSGTDVFFGSNTIISSDDLTLVPSSNLILNGTGLNKNTVLLYSSSNVSISRVHLFSNAVTNFSGSIQIKYLDTELNGIMEPALRLNIHNDVNWQSFANNTNNDAANTVSTSLISGITLKELTLADAAHSLPLQWNDIRAYRVAQTVEIIWKTEQENNISHFNVQRSDDSRNWTNVSANVSARNNGAQKYQLTDHDYQKQQLFYRIKQSDNDGKTSYSRIISVIAENSRNTIILFPNPVSNKFSLTGDLTRIAKIELYSITGGLIKSWKEMQGSYDIHELPSGIYSIRLNKKDDKPQTIQISKQ